MIYCTICKDYFKKEQDDLWDCIELYERKNNYVYKTMKIGLSNLQMKKNEEYESVLCQWSKSHKLYCIIKK